MAEFITPPRASRSAGPMLSHWLGSKFLNVPLAMHGASAKWLGDQIRAGAFGTEVSVDVGASKFVGARDSRSAYRVTDDGIAIVAIAGTLVDRGDFLGDYWGWMTSYEGLAEQFRRLAKDDAIKSVILDIDSGGGMVAGLLDLIAEMAKLKKAKKVTAIAANFAASAAYAIGSAADELFVTRTGEVGSIGVIALHQSMAGMLDKAGVETTIIFAGSHKADGNSYQALSHGARAEMAASIDDAYAKFVGHVAASRKLSEDAVRATQARVFSGDKAVTAGLADGVKSFEETLEHVRAGMKKAPSGTPKSATTTAKRSRSMSDNTGADDRSVIETAITTAVRTIEANRTAAVAPAAAPVAVAAPVAAADSRERIKAILNSDAAKSRPALAQKLALETDVSAETAATLLAAAAEEKPAAADATVADALAAQMAKPGNAAGVKPDAGESARPSLADKVKARHAKTKAA